MTQATDAGFVVGKKYRMMAEEAPLTVGQVLTFTEDDDSNCPWFVCADGYRHCPYLDNLSNKVVEDEEAVTQQTPCQRLGYKVGDKFRVITGDSMFEIDEIVTLIDDDGTDIPKFKGNSRSAFAHLSEVVQVPPEAMLQGAFEFSRSEHGTSFYSGKQLTADQIGRILAIVEEA